MPRRVQLLNLTDFSGGLNLRADSFQLADNESPDLLNVDIDPRGGFRNRRVARPFVAQSLGGAVKSLWQYANSGGLRQVMAQVGNNVKHSTGGSWRTAFTQTSVLPSRAATFRDRCYVVNGEDQAVRWDGSEAVRLGTKWNDDVLSPTDTTVKVGNMPLARFVAVHSGLLWVAGTTESGNYYPNRVRFSHPNRPEDWREDDYFDVDSGKDGDYITALVPYRDKLIVFKRNSIHEIHGYAPENFQVFPVDRHIGAISSNAVVETDIGLAFFSWPEGVFVFNGSEIRWLFDRVEPAISDGTIPDAYASGVSLGWASRKLWVNVPWQDSTHNTRSFVYDPTLGKHGAWTVYDLPLGPMLTWEPAGGDALLLAAVAGGQHVVKLEQDGAADDLGSGPEHVAAHLTTRWHDISQPGQIKRWRRPEFIVQGGATATLNVKVFKDYDTSNASRQFTIDVTAAPDPDPTLPTSLVWNSGNWNVKTWDGNIAGEGSEGGNKIVRGTPFSNARAVQLRIEGPSTNVPWGVDAVIAKFIPRKVR